jgi:hypothetical protein
MESRSNFNQLGLSEEVSLPYLLKSLLLRSHWVVTSSLASAVTAAVICAIIPNKFMAAADIRLEKHTEVENEFESVTQLTYRLNNPQIIEKLGLSAESGVKIIVKEVPDLKILRVEAIASSVVLATEAVEKIINEVQQWRLKEYRTYERTMLDEADSVKEDLKRLDQERSKSQLLQTNDSAVILLFYESTLNTREYNLTERLSKINLKLRKAVLSLPESFGVRSSKNPVFPQTQRIVVSAMGIGALIAIFFILFSITRERGEKYTHPNTNESPLRER